MNRLVSTTALALAVAAFAAAPALAGGGTTDFSTSVSMCAQDGSGWVYQLEDGSTVFANEASGAGCVYVRSYPAGYLRLDHVDLAPGWSYVVKSNGEGTSSRVQLRFTDSVTGRTVDFRVEYGKTKIG